jgi:hypothetical protein
MLRIPDTDKTTDIGLIEIQRAGKFSYMTRYSFVNNYLRSGEASCLRREVLIWGTAATNSNIWSSTVKSLIKRQPVIETKTLPMAPIVMRNCNT